MVSTIRNQVAAPFDISMLPAAVEKVNSGNKLDMISGLITIRRIISFEDTIYLADVLATGVLPRLC